MLNYNCVHVTILSKSIMKQWFLPDNKIACLRQCLKHSKETEYLVGSYFQVIETFFFLITIKSLKTGVGRNCYCLIYHQRSLFFYVIQKKLISSTERYYLHWSSQKMFNLTFDLYLNNHSQWKFTQKYETIDPFEIKLMRLDVFVSNIEI